MTAGTDLDSVAPNLTPVTTAIGVVATRNPHRSHFRSFHRSSHVTTSHMTRSSSSYHCCHHDTPHCRPSSHRNTSQDDSRSQHRSRKQHYKPAQISSSTSQAPSWKHTRTRDTNKSQLMTFHQNTTAQMTMTADSDDDLN